MSDFRMFELIQEIARDTRRILRRLGESEEREIRMSAEIDALEVSVKANTDAEKSAVELLTKLSDLIKAAGTDPVKLKELTTDLDSSRASLAAAIQANTPAVTNAGSAGTAGHGVTDDAQKKQLAAAAAQQKYQPVQRPPEPPPSPQNVEHGNPPGSPDMVAEQDRQEKDHSNKGTMHRDDDKDAASKDDSSKRGRKHL